MVPVFCSIQWKEHLKIHQGWVCRLRNGRWWTQAAHRHRGDHGLHLGRDHLWTEGGWSCHHRHRRDTIGTDPKDFGSRRETGAKPWNGKPWYGVSSSCWSCYWPEAGHITPWRCRRVKTEKPPQAVNLHQYKTDYIWLTIKLPQKRQIFSFSFHLKRKGKKSLWLCVLCERCLPTAKPEAHLKNRAGGI